MKQKSTALAAALAMTLFAVSTRPACAQVLYGSAVGSVLDQTGAVVSGADVSFTNRIRVQQGQRRRMGRGCTGFNLDAGTYDLTSAGPGSASSSRPASRSRSTVARVDVNLQVGQLAEEITVEATQSGAD